MLAPNSDLIYPTPRSSVRVSFVELARAASLLTSGSSRLAFVRISLALELHRDPTPQELWFGFRKLHPDVALRVYRPLAANAYARRRRPSPAPAVALAAEVSLPPEPEIEELPSPSIRYVSTEINARGRQHRVRP